MTEPTVPVDLAAIEDQGGVAWSSSPEGVHVNLVALAAGGTIGRHRNDALDVLLVVLAGDAEVAIDAVSHQVRGSHAVLVPKGAERAITAGTSGVRYLTVHAARGGLNIRGASGDV